MSVLEQTQVPTNWTIKKLGYLASMKSGESITSESISDRGDFPVYGGNGLRGYTSASTHHGLHVLIGRQGALCGNVHFADGDFWASEHAIVVLPKEECDVHWLGEMIRALNLNQYSVSAAQPGISVETVSAIKVPVPPLEDQRRIASFLDHETTRIDALVAEKERMLALLEEKRDALISRVVTHGLNPNAPLKPSGLDWLGEIPAHWDVMRGKFIFTQSSLPVREEDEIVTCFRDGQVTLRRNRREEGFTNAILELGYQGIRNGHLVLHSMDAFAGAIGVSDSDGKCSPEYIICDPTTDNIDSHYYGMLLRLMALRGYVRAACSAVRERAPRIRFSHLANMPLPIPPIEEQENIVSFINAQRDSTSELETILRCSIDLLKERRSALITAAVTGQIPPEEMTA